MKSELTPRQWALYNFLKNRCDEWTHAEEVAIAVYEFNSERAFIGSGAQRALSADIQEINDSNTIQKIIMSDKSKGIKLASKDEFDRYIRKEIMAAVRRLLRAKRKAAKGNLDGQTLIVFGSERDTVKAFIDSDMATGERLRAARTAKGLTAAEVVRQAGLKTLDAPMLSKFEKGHALPNKTTLRALCDIYGVSTEYITGVQVINVEGL